MKQRWTTKTSIGLVLWLTLIGLGGGLYAQANRQQTLTAAWQRIADFWTSGQPERVVIPLQAVPLMYNDPVFREVDGRFERIAQVIENPAGYVDTLDPVHVRLFGNAPTYWDDGYLEVHRPARNLTRVAELMLSPERVARIRSILEEAQRENQQQILAELTPLFREALQEMRPTLEAELLASLQSHRPEMEALVEKYKEHIVKEKLVPVVESEVLPVVQKHAQPVVEDIGSEIWNRLSLWRFAWRFLYDESIGSNQPLVNQEWDRFLKQEAIPIVRNHTEDLIGVQTAIIEELAANPMVRRAIQESFREVTSDEEAKQLVRQVLQEGLTRNERVKRELQKFFEDEKTQAVLRRVGDRFEPYAVRIGQELFGTPDQVTREFALVLRHMILRKDQRWIIWKPGKPPGFPEDLPPPKNHHEDGIPLIWSRELSMPPFFQDSIEPELEL